MECFELLIIFSLTLFGILMFYLGSRETIEQSKILSYERKLLLFEYRELALCKIKAKESLLNNTQEIKSDLVDFKFEIEDALTKLRGKINE